MNICIPNNPKKCATCRFLRSHDPSPACLAGHFRGCPRCVTYAPFKRKSPWGYRGSFNRCVMPRDPDFLRKVAALKEARDLCSDVVLGVLH